jgi:hypothetical protein
MEKFSLLAKYFGNFFAFQWLKSIEALFIALMVLGG